VTAVIPTFNRADLLPRAICSVLSQTEPRLLVAVYDNASTDDTPGVVARLSRTDPRLLYHRHERNIGAAPNYNWGIARVTTPYFMLLGDDDLILPDLFAEAVAALQRHPDAIMFCARTIIYNERIGAFQHRPQTWRDGLHRGGSESARAMVRQHFVNTGVVFRREIRESNGYFDELGSDRIYLISAAARHSLYTSERELAVMAVHPRSFSGGARGVRLGEEEATRHWSVEYVLDLHRATLQALQRAGALQGDDAGRIRDEVNASTRRELAGVYLLEALPGGDGASIAAIRAAARELSLDALVRFALWVATPLLRSRTLSRFLGRIARLAHSTVIRSAPSSEEDEKILKYIRSLKS
jgi:hypothetical protein